MFHNINQCDIFIAGSTGPLHVAAALNKNRRLLPFKNYLLLEEVVIQLILIEITAFTDTGSDKKLEYTLR